MRFLALIITLLCATLGITASAAICYADTHNLPPRTSPIIEGTIGPSSLFPAVAEIFIEDGICTGTLIAPEYILTAGHCVFNDHFQLIRDMGQITVQVGGETRGARSIHVHPDYRDNIDACTDGHPDASLIRLDAPVLKTAPIPLAITPPTVGEQLLLVGYGMLGNGLDGQNGRFPGAGELAYGYTPVEQISSTFVSWKFHRKSNTSNTAGGDSGGPAFQIIAGEKKLSAITCGGTSNAEWGSTSYDTRVDILADWLTPFLNESTANLKPHINTAAKISGRVHKSFSHFITVASPIPASLSATGLPPGLSLKGNTIEGIPSLSGNYKINLIATNQNGSHSTQITLNIRRPDTTLVIDQTLLRLNQGTFKTGTFTMVGRLFTTRPLIARYRRLTFKIGKQSETFLIQARNLATHTNGRSFAITQVSESGGNRISLAFRIKISDNSLIKELNSLGFNGEQSKATGTNQLLKTVFEYGDNQIVLNQELLLDSKNAHWHLMP